MPDSHSQQLIRGGRLASNPWSVILDLAEDETAATVTLPPTPVLVPLAVWLCRKAELLSGQNAGGKSVGVWLGPTDEPAEIADDLPRLGLVAIRFPKFTDGRGYSTARLIRERYGYRGELRALGDIHRDQLFFLARVGFDSFLIADGRDAEMALSAFKDFPEVYQGAVDQPLPLFSRRAG